MIEAAFFARFLPKTGPTVLHEWPEGFMKASESSTRQPVVDFSTISHYVIPRQDLCQQSMSMCLDGYRILGHPVCLVDTEKYLRNEYIFNFCLVVKDDIDFSAYEKAVAKIARLLSDAEEQEDYLLNDEEILLRNRADEHEEQRYVSKVQAFCEDCVEDLNRYNECIIPLTDAHELNIKLFPSQPPAPVVMPFHVPLSKIDLVSTIDESWDLTMHRIAPHIDGVNHVSRIADFAEADMQLVQQAIRQFLRFGLVVLLDIFQYGAIYAPTPNIQRILYDTKLQDECASLAAADRESVSPEQIVRLYTTLSHGVTLKSWMRDHEDILHYVDLRRFIIVGLVNDIIYRVHRYALKEPTASTNKDALPHEDHELEHLLDGAHNFDEICTKLSIGPQDLASRLHSRKDVCIIER